MPHESGMEELFSGLYQELGRMAKREIARRGGPALALGVSSLLHEAYEVMSTRPTVLFPDQARFLAYVARVMRGLIIDHTRRRRAEKRGGRVQLTPIETDLPDVRADEEQLNRLGDALEELAKVDPRLAEVVDLKFFGGFSFGEIAEMRGVSERTIQRSWEKARLYLHRAMRSSARA